MAKNNLFINSLGQATTVEAEAAAKVVTDSKKATFDLDIMSLPDDPRPLLAAAEDQLGNWLAIRKNMAKPSEEGDEVRIDNDSDHFGITAPEKTSLSDAMMAQIDGSWTAFMGQFIIPQPADQPEGQPEGQPEDQPADQPEDQPDKGQPADQPDEQQPEEQPDKDQPEVKPFDICTATREETLAHNCEENPFLKELI